MRMFRSFLLRLGLILSTTAVICLFLMAATLLLQKQYNSAQFVGLVFLVVFLWFICNWFMVRKIDPELSLEVARIVFPCGILFSNLLSILLSFYLKDLVPGTEGREHYILPFVGAGVSFYLIVRCFDLKWLRPEQEIAFLERMDRR